MKVLLLLFICIWVGNSLEIPKNRVADSVWLEQNIQNPKLKIVDVRSEKDFNQSHIPNSVNIPKSEFFLGVLGDVKSYFTSSEKLAEIFSSKGIANDDIVIFYSAGKVDEDFADSASGVWNAWIYGFENSLILDGGFAKWEFEKRVITNEIRVPKVTSFEFSKFNKKDIASIDEILEAIVYEDLQISDARTSKPYLGEVHRKDIPRSGRIPSAKLTPVMNLVHKQHNLFYTLISKDDAKKTLQNSGFGIDLSKPLITYCNTGHKARGVWFVAKFVLGMSDVSVYDGGMVEYSKTNFKVETGEPF